MIVSCQKCGAALVFSAHPVDWPKDCLGAYCACCHRVYAVMVEVVKESDLSPEELAARRIKNS